MINVLLERGGYDTALEPTRPEGVAPLATRCGDGHGRRPRRHAHTLRLPFELPVPRRYRNKHHCTLYIIIAADFTGLRAR